VSFLNSLLGSSLGVYDIIGVSNYRGAFSSLAYDGLGGWLFGQLRYTVNGVQLAVVLPEPGSYALLLAGLGALGWSTRRRKRT
jgi:hypothetical protein